MIEERILNLPTHRLLAYFKKHYRDRKGRIEYSVSCGEHGNYTQEDLDEFMKEFNTIKVELDNREHVEK